jgi:hypothetical protein
MKSRKKTGAVALVAGVALALPFLVGVAPASASGDCNDITYDPSNGYATANCTGDGVMRFVVSCHAIWPFTAWTKYSEWIDTPADAIHVFPSCAAPYSVRVQY